MKWIDILIATFALAFVVLMIVRTLKKRKEEPTRGCGGCNGCSSCPHGETCPSRQQG